MLVVLSIEHILASGFGSGDKKACLQNPKFTPTGVFRTILNHLIFKPSPHNIVGYL